jgi:pyruvate dehydrogenase E2 component (dihydrolipoamide acetyltransferase)
VELEAIRGSAPGSRVAAKDIQGAGPRLKVFSSPRARKRADELKVDWHSLPGTGPGGRVIERDVLRAAAERRPLTVDREPAPIPNIAWESPTLVQRVAAYRMATSFSTAPHFYLSAEARADAILGLRDRLLPEVERRIGVRLTVTDLLVKIVATALKEHPRANAFWNPEEGGRIGLHLKVHLGIAVATDAGLVVPVLRDVASMGLAQITAERDRLVEKARRGKLSLDELEGSTFTLTNLGMYRVDAFQAILNPPQSAILAVGRIVERPAVVAGQVCARPTMVVTLSCDHRVLDGVLGAQFLGRVVELIEEPYGLIA